MTEIRLTHDIDGLRRAMRRAPDVVMREIDRSLRRGANEVARDARALAPKATSELTQSILVSRPARADYLVQARAQHAAPVEQGRRAGAPMPPVQSLIDWIRTRGIEPRDPTMTEDDLAFVIGRKIARDGIPAQPYMAPALERNESRLTRLMRDGAERGVRRAFA